MSKRARYNGDVDVRVAWPAGEVYDQEQVIVEPGALLPAEVPASVRDELLARPDWSEVKEAKKRAAKKPAAKPAAVAPQEPEATEPENSPEAPAGADPDDTNDEETD